MKNLKLDILVVTVIVAGVAIIVSFVALFFAPLSQQRYGNVAQVPKTQKVTNSDVAEVPQNTVYTNTEFGFQITFPSNWDNKYKAVTTGPTEVTFVLPTAEEGWQNSIAGYPGYAMIFGLKLLTKADWNKSVAECKKGGVPGENPDTCGQNFVGETSQYIVAWFHPQDGPTDFVQYYNASGPEYLSANFKAL